MDDMEKEAFSDRPVGVKQKSTKYLPDLLDADLSLTEEAGDEDDEDGEPGDYRGYRTSFDSEETP